MKRWMLRILLCLILGAITTVAVAWGIALVDDLRSGKTDRLLITGGDYTWVVIRMHTAGSHAYNALGAFTPEATTELLPFAEVIEDQQVSLDAIPTWASFQRIREVGGQSREASGPGCLDIARGWPFLALRCALRWQWIVGASKNELRTVGGIACGHFPHEPLFPRVLPLLPIASGFVIDTLFYAAIWGGVWFGFVGGKRLIRAKRGRCPRCGYDLRGNLSAGCSECGWNRKEGAS